MTTIEYTILKESGSYAAEELADRVREAIEAGWHPLGGVAMALAGGNLTLAQAMTRTAPDQAAEG